MSITSKVFAMLGLTPAAREEVKKEINFFEALQAHVAWKKRLFEYIAGRSKEDLQPYNICVDNRCVLGQWIHGPGKARFGEEGLFKQLTEEHAKFHYHASKVVEAHQAGNAALAEKILHEDFARQSKKTEDCLTKLYIQVEGK